MLVRPQLSYPGVYVQEVSGGPGPIAGVPTSITAFIGRAKRGPVEEPFTVNNFAEFAQHFGGLGYDFPMSYAVRDFFQAGGAQAVIVRVFDGDAPAEVVVCERSPWLGQARDAFRDGVDEAFKLSTLEDIEGRFRDLKAQFDERPLQASVAKEILDAILQEIGAVEGDSIPATLKADVTAAIEPDARKTVNGVDKAALEAAIDTAETAEAAVEALRKASREVDVAALKTTVTALFVDEIRLTADLIADAKAAVPANLHASVKTAIDNALNALNVTAGNEHTVQKARDDVAAITVAGFDADVAAARTAVLAIFPDAAVTEQMLTGTATALTGQPAEVLAAFNGALAGANTIAAARAAIGKVPDKIEVPVPGDLRNAAAFAVERGLDALKPPPADAAALQTEAKKLLPAEYLALAAPVFRLRAANAGAWANDLRAWVDYVGIDDNTAKRYAADELKATQLFNLHLALVDARGQILEREDHHSVTLLPGTSRTLGLILENNSALARTDDTEPTGKRPPDDAGGWVDAPVGDSAYLKIKHYASLEEGKGFNAFDKADLINLLVVPPDQRDASDFGGDTHTAVYAAAVAYARKRRAFLIVDGPAAWEGKAAQGKIAEISPNDLKINGELARYAGVYFPRVKMADPEKGDTIHTFPVSGLIAGLYSRTDATRGVWKAPAGIQVGVNGIDSLTHKLTDAQNGQLNPLGINCLRTFPVTGTVVWGARTLAGADQKADEYTYIPVRRTASYIVESVYRGTQWAVFEPNDEPLWAQLRLQIGAFMNGLFRQGAFQGSAAKDAWFVRCDATTTTQTDIDLGIVNVVVGFAPLKPAEFVVIYIQQKAGANQ